MCFGLFCEGFISVGSIGGNFQVAVFNFKAKKIHKGMVIFG